MTMDGEGKNYDRYVAMLAQRQCAIHTKIACRMEFMPENDESAGLAIVQAMNHQMHLERAEENGKQVLRLVMYTSDFTCPPYFPGFESETHREILAETEWKEKEIVLEIEMEGEMFYVPLWNFQRGNACALYSRRRHDQSGKSRMYDRNRDGNVCIRQRSR